MGHGVTRWCSGQWRAGGEEALSSGWSWAGCLLTPAPSAFSDIINSSSLAGELQGLNLGSLLPPKQIRLLEATFLSNEVVSP